MPTDFSIFTISPVVSKHYDNTIPSKRRGVEASKNQCVNISMQMLDTQGDVVDLTPFDIALSVPSDQVKVRFAEAVFGSTGMARNSSQVLEEESGEISDAETGTVVFPVPTTLTELPGVYIAEVAILNSGGYMHFSNTIYIYVNQGLFNTGNTIAVTAGPPTLDDIRLAIRDNGPEDNLLLDDIEFDIAEISSAAQRVVMTWNEAQPPIQIFFNTQNFPFKEKMLLGMTGLLFRAAGMRSFRNDFPYQAGGLSIDDMGKWKQYLPVGKELWEEYTTWVRQKKAQLNAEAAIGSLGSSYGFYRNG